MEALIEQLGSTDIMIRHDAREQLLQIGTAAVEPLLRSLSASDNYHLREAIISVLAEIGDIRAVDALIQELEHGNLPIRMISAKALGSFDTPEVFSALYEHLLSDAVVVQIWIVESLGKLGDRRAINLLVRVLHATFSPALRCTIMQVLAEFGERAAIPHVALYKDDPDEFVRGIAQNTIQRLIGGTYHE